MAATDGHSAVASVISLLLSCECVSFADVVPAGFLIVFMIWSADKGSLSSNALDAIQRLGQICSLHNVSVHSAV